MKLFTYFIKCTPKNPHIIKSIFLALLISLFPLNASCEEDLSNSKSYGYSTSSAKNFYDGFDKSRRLSENKQYDKAVRSYKAILVFADSKSEQSMVFVDLSNIYQNTGDLENEIYYVERAVDVTFDTKQKRNLLSRSKKLRSQARRIGLKIENTP